SVAVHARPTCSLPLASPVGMTVRGPLVGVIFGVIAMLGAAWFKPAIQLVFNPTDSAPRGWYFITPAARFRVGDYVVAQIPRAAASLAAARGYLPMAVPLLKQLGPLPACAYVPAMASSTLTA